MSLQRLQTRLTGKGLGFNPAAAAAKSLQLCPTVRPHRWQPIRLNHPWNFHFCMDVRNHLKFSVPQIELTDLSSASPICFQSVFPVLVNNLPKS